MSKAIAISNERPKFRKPKNGHFNCYCYECNHWTYERTRGMVHCGVCDIDDTEEDAYGKPCGAFVKKKR